MIKLPNSIKIGGRNFTVKFPHEFRDNELQGEIRYGTQEIHIGDKDLYGKTPHKDSCKQALVHEILHGIDLVFNAHSLSHDDTTRLSEGIFQVLNDNPEFVELFVSKK